MSYPYPSYACPRHDEQPTCGCGQNRVCRLCGAGRGAYPCGCARVAHPRVLGLHIGMVWTSEDFDAPLMLVDDTEARLP